MPTPLSRLSPAISTPSLLLGAASGLRSQMGMPAVVVGTRASRLPGPLRGRRAKVIAAALAAGELVVDKLPATPARTQPPGLLIRVALGAAASGLAARSSGAAVVPAARVGGVTALGAAFVGLAARSALSVPLPSVVAALIEDAVAAGLAAAGVRLASAA